MRTQDSWYLTRLGALFLSTIFNWMTYFDAIVFSARKRPAAWPPTGYAVNVTSDAFPQFVFSVAVFFRQGSAWRTMLFVVTIMDNLKFGK